MIMERSDVVSRDPEVLQGDLAFAGTRVPAAYLIDYLWDDAIDEFLLDYPSVRWEQVEELLAAACGALQRLHAAPRAVEVSATADELVVHLRSGDVVRVPLALFPILAAASPEERARWELIGGGVGIRWRTLDVDVPVRALVHPGSRPSVITRVLDDYTAARQRLEMDSRLRARLTASLAMSPEARLRSLDATLSRLWSARRRWTDAYPQDVPLWEEYIRRLDTIDPDVVLRTIAALEEILPGASAAGDDEVRRRLARGE